MQRGGERNYLRSRASGGSGSFGHKHIRPSAAHRRNNETFRGIMKTEKQTKFKQYVGHEMAEQRGEKTVRKGKISRDFIKSPGVSLGLSLLAAASLALVSG